MSYRFMPFHDEFADGVRGHWHLSLVGGATIEKTSDGVRLVTTGATDQIYSNAQIDDYGTHGQRRFGWRPPLTLSVRARFSHGPPRSWDGGDSDSLRGTAGFGFWNDPFMMSGGRLPRLPRAIWFFYSSPPSNMKLALDVPGWGWKVATIDAARWPFLFLLPTAPVAMLLMRSPRFIPILWPVAQRAIRISEARVESRMTEWHTYTIVWQLHQALFSVDGNVVMACTTPPAAPLGLVIWLDNQYMVVTPWGAFDHGFVRAPGCQWLELDSVSVQSGAVRS